MMPLHLAPPGKPVEIRNITGKDEVRRHLFERGATSKGKGHGTGLYLVKQIVDAYHGDIRVESTRGVGSSFVITFRPGADAPEA